MLYQFKCKNCDHEQEDMFQMVDYDEHVAEDGLLKDKHCEKCNTISLYRHITRPPGVLGGTKGYVSMERWQRMHPDHYKRKAAELEKQLADRKRKRVLDKINKQVAGGKRDQRHKDYGEGKGEEKQSID